MTDRAVSGDTPPERCSTGVPGLDEVLSGGLLAGRSYLVRGPPGSGKSVLGLHFLNEGVSRGETVLYINLEETEDQIRENGASLGMDVEGVDFLDVTPDTDVFTEEQDYSVFEPDEVDGGRLADSIVSRVEAQNPDRVFLDPVTHLRYLSPDEYQFRKEVIGFMRFLAERSATVLFTSQQRQRDPDDDLQFLADGVLSLDQSEYGRSITVPKFRGSDRQAGTHALRIDDDGLAVFPELVPGDHAAEITNEVLPTGIDQLDELLGGGIGRGTITVISGPTGVGKTTTGTKFLEEAARRGEHAVLYMFEESEATLRHRSRALGMDVDGMVESGKLDVEEVEPLDLSPEAFASSVREQVEEGDARVVMIDGIAGYKLSLQGEDEALVRKLHALARYCKNLGVTVVLIDEIDSVTGDFRATDTGISYLADNILFLRHVEADGELRKTVGVLKKRVGDFERTLREFSIESGTGLSVGEPLRDMQGILRGTPAVDDGETE